MILDTMCIALVLTKRIWLRAFGRYLSHLLALVMGSARLARATSSNWSLAGVSREPRRVCMHDFAAWRPRGQRTSSPPTGARPFGSALCACGCRFGRYAASEQSSTPDPALRANGACAEFWFRAVIVCERARSMHAVTETSARGPGLQARAITEPFMHGAPSPGWWAGA